MKFTPRMLKLNELLLDPNNHRFFDNPDFKKRVVSRFHIDSVQEATIRLLEKNHIYQLKELRNSILANGYVPMERIVVTRYEHKQGKFLIITITLIQ